MPRLSIEQRAQVITLIEEGYSTRYIASKIGIHQSTVVRTYQHMQKTGTIKDQPKSGRPRIFSVHTERRIVRLIASKECSTAVDIQGKLRTEDNLQVSSETVR